MAATILSDMANLSWAKNAVLIAAERELDYERAIDPSKCPVKGGVSSNGSSPMRYFSEAAEWTPSSPPNLISVLSSSARGVVGFLLTSARGFRAFDQDGRPIGYFGSKEGAVASIYESCTAST